MAYFYTYIDPAEIEAQFKTDNEDDENNKNKLQKLEVETTRKDSTESDSEGKQMKLWKKEIPHWCVYTQFIVYTKENVL